MNANKAKKHAITAIVLNISLIVLSIILYVGILAVIVQGSQTMTEQEFSELIMKMAGAITISILVPTILGIVHLVFYILAIVESSKLEENRNPFVLLIVGLFVGLVGLIGLIMLIMAANEKIKQDEEEQRRVSSISQEQ